MARDFLQKAVAQDPRFARAHAALADLYVTLPQYADDFDWRESNRMARMHTARAIALDAKLAGPHATLANLDRIGQRYTSAEREFLTAIELEPTYATTYHWYSRLLGALGRTKEAVKVALKAKELDPLSSIISANLGVMQTYAGEYAAADSTFKLAVALDPANPVVRIVSSELYLATENYPRAMGAIDSAMLLQDNPSSRSTYGIYRAFTMARSGNAAPARNLLKKLKTATQPKDSWTDISLLHVALSEPDSAIRWIGRYVSDPENGDLTLFLRSPLFKSISRDSRFQNAMRVATGGQ
jgi:Tfp pilus assembly protein PilF